MSKLRITTFPKLIETSEKHKQALAEGTDHFRSWTNNVSDRFKSQTIDEIKAILKAENNSFAVCFEHVIGDFNMSTGIRNANAFNAKEVFYIGDKKWDRRGAVGVHNYTEVKWLENVNDLVKLKDKYVFVGIDNIPGSVSISSYEFPKNTLMIFGEEGVGLTPAIQSLCKDIVHIDMFGTVRSLNCGVASGIAMFQYLQYHKINY